MATMQFSANSIAATEAFSRCNSITGLFARTSRCSKSKLLLISTRTMKSRPSRRFFSVRNVSGETKQKLNDPVTHQQEATTSLSAFTPDAASTASSIKYHAEFTPLFSPEEFELPKAFYATAQSVRDALIINWNATYDYYEKLNVKQAYYLSVEFLQGRALLNAIGNLELTGPYAEALSRFGHTLENVACQDIC